MIIRCSKGHFYDSDTGHVCPHCSASNEEDASAAQGSDTPGAPSWSDMELTIAKHVPYESHDSHTVFFQGQDNEKTIGIQHGITQGLPVVGWLVCISGPERGRDYRLHAGRNFIGRSWTMDVCIMEDRTVSRTNHASIVYDPLSGIFSFLPGDSVATTYNGQSLTSPQTLTEKSILGIGESEFVFVAYCKGEIKW